MISGQELLAALPVAVYTTDPNGSLTAYNDAAAALWGYRPEVGSMSWCGSWSLFWPDGRPMPHDQSPMAVSLREGRPVRGVEAVAERPDGTRVPFMPYPSLLRDADGRIAGAVNLLVDISDRDQADLDLARLAAIVSSSDDAIVSKTLDGRITSWNAAAERLFGHAAADAIGRHITLIIPPELRAEEEQIIAKLRRGERVEHFDTVRVTRDGRRIDVSLTVSPLRDRNGKIVGASKIARDVTDRKQGEALQRLLFDELNHRVKNTLATIQAIANQSLRRAASPNEFVTAFNGRVQALARAHDLLVRGKMQGADVTEIVREQVVLEAADAGKVHVSGPFLLLDARASVQLALVLHELATNARKYGALSVPAGRLAISWDVQLQPTRELKLEWRESGVPNVRAPERHGFGTMLIERSLQVNGGSAPIHFKAGGVLCAITLPLPSDATDPLSAADRRAGDPGLDPDADPTWLLAGKRILVVEDEPLIAMEIEAQLTQIGCTIVGPAGSIEAAEQLIAKGDFDAALLDANLAGRRADPLAALLVRAEVPFAFATGYGPAGLPEGVDAPVLAKPFVTEDLKRVLRGLVAPEPMGAEIVSLKPNRA